MAIRGNLSEFSVAEILQLLALQQKSGVLAITDGGQQTQVLFFEHGRVMAAADRRQDGRHNFLAYLMSNSLLSQDQLESVEDICRATGHDLFTVMVSSGVVGRDRMLDEMRRYTQRIIDDVVDWRNGTYEFSGDEKSLPVQGISLKLNPEELLLESMRRNDELATLKESMLAPDIVLAVVEDGDKQPLPRDCMVALGLVDGRRSLEELCAVSPLGEYMTYDAISELLSRQQIMIVEPDETERFTAPAPPSPLLSWPAVAAAMSLVLGSLLLGSGLAPLMQRSVRDRDWLPAEVQTSRNQIRAEVRADVLALRETLHR